MKTLLKTLSVAIVSSLIWASPASMAATFGDHYEPYVLYDEILTEPASATTALGERFTGFLLYDDIVVTQGCADPVDELMGERFAGFITPDEFKMAETSTKRC